jgi:predicted PurR-regulated permease PerM
MTWVALLIVGVDFALTLAIITGVLEFVPYLGPIIAVVPAVAVGFSYSPSTALTVFLVFGLIQLLENNLIVPGVMRYSVKLSPLVVIVLILVGGELFGVMGAVLAVPVGTVAKIMVNNI